MNAHNDQTSIIKAVNKNQPTIITTDHIIFSPSDVDLAYSPLRATMALPTYVLGAFNPGLTRLPNGNLLMMVRVAEALSEPVFDNKAHCIRWDSKTGFTTGAWPVESVDMKDPRKFRINAYGFPVFALTSISWLLPVELEADGLAVKQIHYDKIISSSLTSQEYGIEDPRISLIGGRYYMTVCAVSSERHSTMLYESSDGIAYTLMGIVLDHQNKDMLLFEGKIKDKYYALTRPMGECYFATSPDSEWHPGAAIHLSSSPDLVHWKPSDVPMLRARKASTSNVKIGGGTPPVKIPGGWLLLYHGVENKGEVGVYRTFWAVLSEENPEQIIYLQDEIPVLEANPKLTQHIRHQVYLEDVVFTTGIVEQGENYILASGELDLVCRITTITKKYFSF